MTDILTFFNDLNPTFKTLSLLIGLGTASYGVLRAAVKLRVERSQRYLTKRLRYFYTEDEIERATEHYVPTHCQSVDPAQENEPGKTYAFVPKQPLIPWMIERLESGKADKHYILLADSGMGKTTFMLNLFLRYSRRWRKRYKIELLPLGNGRVDEAIEKIEDPHETVLLLDAFDEDALAVISYEERLQELINKTEDFRVVVVTSRTQFFPSQVEEPGPTGIFRFGGDKGEREFKKLYVSPFDDRDVQRFVRKKYRFYDRHKRRRAQKIIDHCPHLVVRPMLLSYIDALMEGDKVYERSSEIYEAMVGRWIERERVTNKVELRRFCDEVAVDIYLHQEQRKGLYIPATEITPFADRHGIKLEEFEMKSRSLLNRDVEGRYKFAHKSILEYLLAVELSRGSEALRGFRFQHMDFARTFALEILEARTGIRLLRIPGGRFRMGDDDFDDAKPVHDVELSPFWLAETPVTNRQYLAFVEATGCQEPAYIRYEGFSHPDQPVVGVSWFDAREYCVWLSDCSGLAIDLPTEAQWEFAARGPEGRTYPWGNEAPGKSRACYAEKKPAPVGSYPAGKGPFGTLDQAGNVWEWCFDAYDSEAYGRRAEAVVRDPCVRGLAVGAEQEPDDEVVRVLRGGSWRNRAGDLRAAFRIGLRARRRPGSIGFRVCAAP